MKILFALAAIVLFFPSSAEAECFQVQGEIECNRPTDGVSWDGSGKVKNQIKVEVCHGYWDLLDFGTYNGTPTKWWEPVMNYRSWYGDLPTVTKPCKTYWVKPGTIIKLYASCVERVISTGQMMKSGRYTMQ